MHSIPALVALTLVGSAAAHTRMWSVWVNGEDQGDGRGAYIRSPDTNSPVKDTTSADIACNTQGGTAVSDFVSAAAGDTLSFEWYHDNRNDDIIAASHLGPVITYIATYPDGDGTGAIWSKIDEEGYDASSSKWAVDNLIANGGKKDFTLPSSLAAGKYLVRQEVIGLHEADVSYTENSARGAQFYPSCVQMDITGSGSALPDEGFDFQTGYTSDSPGVVFNLYTTYDSYPIPGPDLWEGASSGSGSSAGSSSATPTSTAATTSGAATSTAAAATSAAASSSAVATSTASSPTSAASAASSSSPVGGGSCKRRKAKRAE